MTNDNMTVDSDGVLREKLPNGSILLVREDHSTPVVSLNLWVEAGSVDERPDERGMAHLIEHMIFKGTEERGVGEISRQVEAAGGYLNAFTSFEHTCFYVVLPSNQFEKALDIEFDAYLHSTFDAGELAKEKEVVFEEMRMRRDDPWSWSWELLFDILYGKNPYHWPVIGDMKILREVPRERLLAYYKAHYVPSNTVVSVVGDIRAADVVTWVREKFEAVTSHPAPERRFSDDPEPAGLRLKVEPGDVQQAYLSLGFPTVPLTHEDCAPLEILAAVLGDGAASRFNLALREKSQSVDDAAAETFSGKYGGALVFQGLTDMGRVDKALSEMMAEVARVSRDGVPEGELSKVRNKIKASKVFEKQNMDGQAKNLGFWELLGDYRLEGKFLAQLDSVTEADLKRVAERYVRPHRASLVLYHPKSQEAPADAGRWEGLLQKGLDSAQAARPPVRPASSKELRKFRLKNGSTLLVKERRSLPLVSLGAFVPGGFPEETTGGQGLTALLTKCLQKGTRGRNHEQFSQELESYAAHLDASMEKDYWALTLDVLKPNFEKAFGLMREALFEPRFDPAEVEKEKKMQVSAIERLKDDPSEFALLESDILTFAGTPYAHPPMGTVKTVAAASAAGVRRWHASCVSQPLTWVAVGDLDAEELRRFLDARLPGRSGGRGRRTKVRSAAIKPQSRVIENDSQQANLVLGFRAPSFHSGDYFTFRVLNTLLNGMGGRLFLELREKRSLAYSVFASHDAAALAGVYQIYIGCAPSKVEEAKAGLEQVLRSFTAETVSAGELDRAKSYMTGLYQMGLQANRAQVHSYARYELAGWGAALVEKIPSLIAKVTAEEVRKAARKYLETDLKTWVLMGPRGEKKGRAPEAGKP